MRHFFLYFYNLKKGINCFFFFNFILPAYALSQVNDAGLWISATAEKNFKSLYSFYLNPQLRLSENYTQIGSYFFDSGFSYALPSLNIKLTGSYRFAQKRNLNESYSIRHRFYGDFNYKRKAKKILVAYRFRYQYQFKDVNRSDDWQITANYIRNKFTCKFKPDESLRPFVFIDSWYRLNSGPKEFDNIRLGFGLDYEIDKYQSISPSFFMDKEFHVNNPYTNFIIGFDYSYSF